MLGKDLYIDKYFLLLPMLTWKLLLLLREHQRNVLIRKHLFRDISVWNYSHALKSVSSVVGCSRKEDYILIPFCDCSVTWWRICFQLALSFSHEKLSVYFCLLKINYSCNLIRTFVIAQKKPSWRELKGRQRNEQLIAGELNFYFPILPSAKYSRK